MTPLWIGRKYSYTALNRAELQLHRGSPRALLVRKHAAYTSTWSYSAHSVRDGSTSSWINSMAAFMSPVSALFFSSSKMTRARTSGRSRRKEDGNDFKEHSIHCQNVSECDAVKLFDEMFLPGEGRSA